MDEILANSIDSIPFLLLSSANCPAVAAMVTITMFTLRYSIEVKCISNIQQQ